MLRHAPHIILILPPRTRCFIRPAADIAANHTIPLAQQQGSSNRAVYSAAHQAKDDWGGCFGSCLFCCFVCHGTVIVVWSERWVNVDLWDVLTIILTYGYRKRYYGYTSHTTYGTYKN